jgi:spermidine synthase
VDGQDVSLRERGEALDIILNGVVLLSSAALGTEEAFGAIAARAEGGAGGRVLVGGLGFGATVRGVLDACPGVTEVLVAEKTGAIAALLAGELRHLARGVLDDPRVRVVRSDVGEVMAAETGLDAILLDVDNGPDWAAYRGNARLYGAWGLGAALGALRGGGVYAVWSGYPADGFVPRLRAAGFGPEVVPLHEGSQVRARAYVGKKP